jgi:hypothetical protein
MPLPLNRVAQWEEVPDVAIPLARITVVSISGVRYATDAVTLPAVGIIMTETSTGLRYVVPNADIGTPGYTVNRVARMTNGTVLVY